jgi:hypothetical protein
LERLEQENANLKTVNAKVQILAQQLLMVQWKLPQSRSSGAQPHVLHVHRENIVLRNNLIAMNTSAHRILMAAMGLPPFDTWGALPPMRGPRATVEGAAAPFAAALGGEAREIDEEPGEGARCVRRKRTSRTRDIQPAILHPVFDGNRRLVDSARRCAYTDCPSNSNFVNRLTSVMYGLWWRVDEKDLALVDEGVCAELYTRDGDGNILLCNLCAKRHHHRRGERFGD